jgi:flavodoxin
LTAFGSNSETTPATEPTNKANILVAYFSCTGNTRSIGGHVADALKADLYEIQPEKPYTEADLNYRDSSSRTTLEKNDATVRPAISGSVDNMGKYDIVFLGYPIWWGQAPRIVSTFLESYDFSGKIIVPFCTSGSSGIGSSAENLHVLCADSVTWLSGARLASGSSRNDVVKWINGLGLDITAE